MPFSVLRRVHAGDADALREACNGDEPGPGIASSGSLDAGSARDAFARFVEWGATPFPRTHALDAPFVATFAARAELGALPRVFLSVQSSAMDSGERGANERDGTVVLWFKEHASVCAQEGASSLAQRALHALLAVLRDDARTLRVVTTLPPASQRARRLELAGFVPGPDATVWTWTPVRAAAAPKGAARPCGLKRARAQSDADLTEDAAGALMALASRSARAVQTAQRAQTAHGSLVCASEEERKGDEAEADPEDLDSDSYSDFDSDSNSSFDAPRNRRNRRNRYDRHKRDRHFRAAFKADPQDKSVSLRVALWRDRRALSAVFSASADEAGQPFVANTDFVAKVAEEGRHNLSFVALRKSRNRTFKRSKTVVGVVLLAEPQHMFGENACTFPGSLLQRGFALEARDQCVAWFTHAAHRRTGVMAAAVPLVLERARRAGARRVFANIAPFNIASASLARSLGFERVVERLACPEGIMRGNVVDVWMRTLPLV